MGFFEPEEISRSFSEGKRVSCWTCGLHRKCSTPRMPPSGSGKYAVLHVAEAPGREEDRAGRQLMGKSGKYYDKVSRRAGMSIHDGLKTNACICRPEKNATPTPDQIAACRPNLFSVVEEFSPKLIMLVGGAALESYLGHRFHEAVGGISKWRGFVFPDPAYGAWVAPIWHPAYVLRSKDRSPVTEVIFLKDLRRAYSFLNKPLPPPIRKHQIRILRSKDQIKTELRKIIKTRPSLLAFDYETTGLKPQMPEHKLWCVSLCYSEEEAVVFDLKNISKQNLSRFKRVLRDTKIGKTAHNMKFEHTWSRVKLGVEVRGWKFDTMLAAHVFDNRPGITSLKFQIAVHFGLFDYDSHISPFLKGVGTKGANNLNQIHKAPQKDLFIYCGIDSLGQFRLAKIMMEKMNV